MKKGSYEEYRPLLRRSEPTSSAREIDILAVRLDDSSSDDTDIPPRLPLHQQVSLPRYEEEEDVLSLELSQHDTRGQGRPTDPLTIPRIIEYNVREEVIERLDAIEDGFRRLAQRQEHRFETSSSVRQVTLETTRIKVQDRYPKLERYTSDEVAPLINHKEQQQTHNQTRDFIRLQEIPQEPSPKTTPKWKPRSLRTMQQEALNTNIAATSVTQQAEPNQGRVSRVSIKEDRLQSSAESKQLQAARDSKQRASQRLGELLKRASRKESQTTLATDQRVFGSLFTVKTTTTNTAPLGKVEIEGQQVLTIEQTPLPSSSKDERYAKVLGDVQRERQEAERERRELQQLKQEAGGDLADSLKAFLREFHSQPSAGNAKKTG